MATRRMKTIIDGEEPNENELVQIPDVEDETQEESSQDRVMAVLGQISGDSMAKIHVWKMHKGTWAMCKKYDPHEFEDGGFEMIRDAWGPGDFSIRFYGKHPVSQRYSHLKRVEVTIMPENSRAQNPITNPGPSGGDFASLAEVLQRNNQQTIDAIRQMIPAAAPPVDPMAQFMQFATMATTMREMFGGGGNKQKSLVEQMQELQALREIAGELAPGEAKEESLMSLGGKAFELVKTLSNQPQQQPTQEFTMPPRIPQFHAQQPNPEPIMNNPTPLRVSPRKTRVTAEPKINEDLMKLRQTLAGVLAMGVKARELSKGVAEDKEHSDYDEAIFAAADLVYENLPDELLDMLDSLQWFETLASLEPSVVPHKEWLTEVRDEVVNLRNEDDELYAQEMAETLPAAIAPEQGVIDPKNPDAEPLKLQDVHLRNPAP